jgi:hypothetical protein
MKGPNPIHVLIVPNAVSGLQNPNVLDQNYTFLKSILGGYSFSNMCKMKRDLLTRNTYSQGWYYNIIARISKQSRGN